RPRTAADLATVLVGIVDRVTRRMRKAGRVGRTVTLRFRFDDFTRATRSHSLPDATSSPAVVVAAARGLFEANWELIEARGLTLLGLSVANLHDEDAVQLTLPFARSDADRLDEV